MLSGVFNSSLNIIAIPVILATTVSLAGLGLVFFRLRNFLKTMDFIISVQKCELIALQLRVITNSLKTLSAVNEILLSFEIEDERVNALTEEIKNLKEEIKSALDSIEMFVLIPHLSQSNVLSKEARKKLEALNFEMFDKRLHDLTYKTRELIGEFAEESAREVSDTQPKSGNSFVNSLTSIKTGAAVLFGFTQESAAKQPPLRHQPELSEQAQKDRLGQGKLCQKRKHAVGG